MSLMTLSPASDWDSLLARLIPAADRMASMQEEDGAIAWVDDGPWDPWNHTECAMALEAIGYHDQADRAFDCLEARQKDDGSWLGEYGNAVPMKNEAQMGTEGAPAFHDTNFTAYCAVGVWHRYLSRQDEAELNRQWPMVKQAMEFVLSLQNPEGDIAWSAEARLEELDDSLRAGNASIHKSFECAIAIANHLNDPMVSTLSDARNRLRDALRNKPERFDRRGENRLFYAMDWYYPILGGILKGDEAIAHLDERWDTFIEPGQGCRCVSHEPWVTIAETCELVMAMESVGDPRAADLFQTQLQHVDDNGVFWMGYQFSQKVFWPVDKPSWTQAAVILAAYALYGENTAANRMLVSAQISEK